MRRLIVNGVDTYANLGLVLSSKQMTPPEVKRYIVDVPGGDGSIDLTEALTGDVAYSNRSHKFTFSARPPLDFEALKSRVSNLLHGRRFDYRLSWDPGYTYSGRFSVSSYEESPGVGTIVVSVDADPYKLLETRTYLVNAAGGVVAALPCGRKSVQATIEVRRNALVSFGGRTWSLAPGTHVIDDLWLRQGTNRVTINTYTEYSRATWADYAGKTWLDLAGKLLSHIAAGDEPLQEPDPMASYAGLSWYSLRGRTWQQMSHPAVLGDEYAAYLQYEIKEL